MTESEDVQDEPLVRRPQQRGQATRQRLLEAAEGLFSRQGFEGTSIGDVARGAGVGVGTVYHHFADKKAILLELIDRWGERLETLQRASGMERTFVLDPRMAIEGFLEVLFTALRARPSLFVTALAAVDRDPEIARRFETIESNGVLRITELIDLGQRHGLVRTDLDSRQAAILIQHTVDCTASRVVVRADQSERADAIIAELADMICRYVLVDPAPHPAGTR